MNILYCGDRNILDGLILSVLSLKNHTDRPLCIQVLTMNFEHEGREFHALRQEDLVLLDRTLREKNPDSRIQVINIENLFQKNLPQANLATRFTPCCMLRLYADLVDEIPARTLYLDTDVLCRKLFDRFYDQPMEDAELAGVLDYIGRWFFHNRPFQMDYLNSGVLLLNMKRIRENGLFEECRERCRRKRMFMPDQSSLNKLTETRLIWPRAYNEQRILRDDTIFQHFTTGFRFRPVFHMLCVKPWEIDRVHNVLKLNEYDELYEEYGRLKADMAAASAGRIQES